MYGLIGRIKAVAGKRSELAAILAPGEGGTEVWVDQAAHHASLQLPAVRAAIEKGRPLIAGFDSRVETNVLGGIGLE